MNSLQTCEKLAELQYIDHFYGYDEVKRTKVHWQILTNSPRTPYWWKAKQMSLRKRLRGLLGRENLQSPCRRLVLNHNSFLVVYRTLDHYNLTQ